MNDTPKAWVSCWDSTHEAVVFSGKVQVTPEVLKAWLQEPLDSYGNVNLDLAVFHNDRATSDRAPKYKGQIKVDDYNKGKQQQAHAQSAPLPNVEGNSEEPNYDGIPF